MNDMIPTQSDSRPTTNATPPARTGLILALGGAAMILAGLLISLPMLFFGPVIMCSVTLFSVPIGLAAAVMGWKGRRENPRAALAAMLIGLALPPVAFALMWFLGELLYKATA